MSEAEMHKLMEEACGRTLSEVTAKKLIQHLELVLEANKQTNISGIKDFDEAFSLHLLDSLLSIPMVVEEPAGTICDMGSGNGFPGISLAIVTGRDTVLVEATKKKAQILDEFIEGLDLQEKVKVVAQRIEETSPKLNGKNQIVTARALGSLSVLMELSSPLLCIGGALIAYKGTAISEEVIEAEKLKDMLGMKLEGALCQDIPGSKVRRTLYLYRKVKEAEIKLPRKNGSAQNQPLKLN